MSSAPGSLVLRDLSLRFGGVIALSRVSLSVPPGSMTAVIGPNGAGKTSLLNCVSGLYRPQEGSIRFSDLSGREHELAGRKPHAIASLGIARTFQNIELFRHMSVLENLMLGRHLHMRGGVVSGGLYWGAQQREEISHRRVVEEVIDFLEIENVRRQPVASLPYGVQKRVELGRALALEPALLLLDEPMAGMNTEEKEDMARFLLDVHEERSCSIVLIEHDMAVIMDLSDRVAVLDFGRVIAEGTPPSIRENEAVIAAYLGETV